MALTLTKLKEQTILSSETLIRRSHLEGAGHHAR
jgi:hypothetical protein